VTSTCAQCGSEEGENVKLYPILLCWACSEGLGKEERACEHEWYADGDYDRCRKCRKLKKPGP